METDNKILHRTFEAGIALKGIDGILEIIGGLLAFFLSPKLLNEITGVLTQHELSQDPHDLFANYLLKFAQGFSLDTQLFGAFYLLSHGVIKVFIVGSLWKNKLWAYPVAIIFFVLFIFYQLYRYSFTHSLGLIILSVFDAVIVWLTWKEYQSVRKAEKILTA